MRVSINIETLASIHSLGIGTSKDDITPVLTQIGLTREGDALRAMVTDRYIVLTGKYSDAEFDGWEEGETILVDPKALKSVIDIKKADTHRDTVLVTIHNDGVTGSVYATINSATRVDLGKVSATFPPVMNLFPRGTEATGSGVVNIKPSFIAKLAKVLPPEARPERDRVWRFEFRSIENSEKPQPVYAVYSNGDTYELEALIQPNLVRS